MVRVVYIGKENKRRIGTLNQIDNIIVDIVDNVNCETIINNLPNDVIDLFIMNREDQCIEICCLLRKEKRLQHIPIISIVGSTNNISCISDLIVSENVSDMEFLYQVKALIRMKLMDDELKKEKIILELKVKDRTNELENRAERLRITFNSIGDGVIITNETGVIISMNPVAMKLCELDKNDFMDKKLDDVFNVYKNNIKINVFTELSEIRNPYFLLEEVILKTKSGKELIINDSASPMINKEGNLMGIVLVFRDITEDHRIKTQLMNSEERFRNMFDNMKSAVSIYQTNDGGKTFYFSGWNKRAKELENIDENELLGKKLDDVFPFAIRSGFVNHIRKVWETGESIQVPDFYYENEDGSVKGWRSNFIYKNFVTNEVVSIYDDITNRKQIERELEKTLSLVSATLESTADGILVVDYDGNVVLHNKKFMDMWNLPDSFVDEKNDKNILEYVITQLKHPNDFIDKVKYLYSDVEATSFDILEFKDGRFFERYSIPQKINNKTVGRVWSFRDITDKKKSEIELIKAKNRAEKSDKLKSEFLSSMTHEIRTPMNSILGFSSQINKDTPPNKLMDYISIIKSSGELLITIIDDIIDISKLQSGAFKIDKEYFNVNSMLVASEEEYNQHIKNRGKNIKLILELGKFSFKTYSDSNRIKQVLNNLIINAIKFTEKGTITYGYEKRDNDILFFVKDTGIGISEENINKIFERFYRVTSVSQKKQEGTGLGLTICKSIVELLGGKIWVESTLCVGSTFYFTIPIESNGNKQTIKSKILKKTYDWSTKKVLIIEDNMNNFSLLQILLAQTKIKIYHANNGESFYNLIKREKYDIILLDIELPDISGFDILEYIKKNTQIPVIIQTAFGNKENIDKSQQLKVDAYILKPIIWNTLSNEMEKLINR